jgi:hypothetical protein
VLAQSGRRHQLSASLVGSFAARSDPLDHASALLIDPRFHHGAIGQAHGGRRRMTTVTAEVTGRP